MTSPESSLPSFLAALFAPPDVASSPPVVLACPDEPDEPDDEAPPTCESVAASGTRSTWSIETAGAVPAAIAARDARETAPSGIGSPAPADVTTQRSAATHSTTARPAHVRRRRIACRCAGVGRRTALPLAMGATVGHVPGAVGDRASDPPTAVLLDLVRGGSCPYCGPRPMTAGWRAWATTISRRFRTMRAASAGHSASRHTSSMPLRAPSALRRGSFRAGPPGPFDRRHHAREGGPDGELREDGCHCRDRGQVP